MVTPSPATPPRSGIYYFAQGWQLISLPGIRRFVIIPLLLNVLLMGGAFWWLFSRMGDWIARLMGHVSEWLQWLSYLLWPLAVISILLVFAYFFSTIANFIAAPFNGLLAEQLEARLTGKALPDSGVMGMVKDIPRIMKREVQKLAYYLPRAAAPPCCCCCILSLVSGKPWHPCCGSGLAPGCCVFSIAIILSTIIKSAFPPCTKRYGVINSIMCSSAHWSVCLRWCRS